MINQGSLVVCFAQEILDKKLYFVFNNNNKTNFTRSLTLITTFNLHASDTVEFMNYLSLSDLKKPGGASKPVNVNIHKHLQLLLSAAQPEVLDNRGIAVQKPIDHSLSDSLKIRARYKNFTVQPALNLSRELSIRHDAQRIILVGELLGPQLRDAAQHDHLPGRVRSVRAVHDLRESLARNVLELLAEGSDEVVFVLLLVGVHVGDEQQSNRVLVIIGDGLYYW